MSNHLVTSLPISDRQLAQMEYTSSSLELPVSEMPMTVVSQFSNNPESHPFPASIEKTPFLEPISCDPGFKATSMPISTSGQNGSPGVNMGMNSGSIWMSNQINHGDTNILDNVAAERMSLPVKRKAEDGTLPNNSMPQQPVLPNKRPVNTGTEFGFLQPSGTQKRTPQAQPKLGSPGSQTQPALSRKMGRNDSMSGRSGSQRGPASKKQTTQIESASKGQESSDAVRSKMRESLAAALALAFDKKNNVSKTEKVNNDPTVSHQVPLDSKVSESNSKPGGIVPGSGSEGAIPPEESAVAGKTSDCQVLSVQHPPNESSGNSGQTFQEFQYGSISPEDIPFSDNFFVKDDLLQGNGLSWAFDFDAHMRAEKESQNTENPQSVKQEAQDQKNASKVAILTPGDLAFAIEAELFKLFSGVNKKYKEKGRSLLFNLKDRNNPELRERVMSGEISPERLCAMSAEELASKELSEWRMAKAEHFEQMVVLPDTEVDIRRLVKKTHKGEYQVEVERDDDIAAEVSGGTSLITQPLPKKETRPPSPSVASPKDNENVAGPNIDSENQDLSGSLIIPTDGTDLMQGMMVDELKDAEFLPPIVSLDEFMESLNSEPPFGNLPTDAGQKSPVAHETSPKAMKDSGASDRPSESPKKASFKKPDAVRKHELDSTTKPTVGPAKPNVLPGTTSKAECVWEGDLQLHISSSVSVSGLFESGEKTSTGEWPASIEIKGRVRLEAFEKFLQELPMSRTRAVMILKFDLKDKQSEKERSNFSEAIDSFSADERLGYAEPASGVELYICPPTSRITEMLNKHMPSTKERPNANNSSSMENALIGVVVWRRSHHISNKISPNSSSHHKHASKKQHVSPPRRVPNSSNVNLSSPTPTSRTPHPVLKKPEPQPQADEDDDDIPPGFGPMAAARAAAKDDDDLPEFNFSSGASKPPSFPTIVNVPSQNLHHHGVKMTQTPVDQVRELIQKYGQSGTPSPTNRTLVDRNLGLVPCNDDDDDDIPEWRPQLPLHQQPAYAGPYGHRPPSAHHLPTSPRIAPHRGAVHPPPGGRWVQPPGPPHGARWRRH